MTTDFQEFPLRFLPIVDKHIHACYNEYMNQETQILLNALKSVLNGVDPEAESLPRIIGLAKKHSVLNLLAPTLLRCNDEKLRRRITAFYAEYLSQQESLKAAAEELFAELEKRNIPYMPLKGYYMKQLYPDPLMRSSCDLDVLFPPEHTKEVKKIMRDLGYTLFISNDHHMCHTRENVTVEMHYILSETPVPGYYDDIFARLRHIDGCLYGFTDEDFYIFLIAHIFKHFKNGGTGIRSVMDLYVFRTKKTLDEEYLLAEFEKLGLVSFEEKLRRLAFSWFGEESGEGLESLSDFILQSGVYGTVANSAAAGAAEMGKGKYFLRRAFPKVSAMKKTYPVLQKCILLLPFCYIARFLRALFTKPGRVKGNVDAIRAVDENRMNEMKKLFDEMGI